MVSSVPGTPLDRQTVLSSVSGTICTVFSVQCAGQFCAAGNFPVEAVKHFNPVLYIKVNSTVVGENRTEIALTVINEFKATKT